jgi:hypothetical protein
MRLFCVSGGVVIQSLHMRDLRSCTDKLCHYTSVSTYTDAIEMVCKRRYYVTERFLDSAEHEPEVKRSRNKVSIIRPRMSSYILDDGWTLLLRPLVNLV